MSRIVLLSYYFPPIGGAGTQRPLRFARYLHERGHDVLVLTGSGSTGALWTPADPTLERDIPPGVEVVRVPGPEPGPSGRMRERVGRMARLDTRWERWWQTGIATAGASIRDADVIHTIMSPYSSADPSRLLSHQLGIGWIADLGDPWAMDEMMVFPTGLHRQLEMRRMRRLLGSAAAIVMSTPEAARQLVGAFPELADRPVVAIPNGYDAADFASAEADARDPEKFRIVHSGYLHTEAGLAQRRRSVVRQLIGGMTPGVDILTRSHVFLLEAVDRLLERDPTLSERLEVHFAGVISDIDRELASRSPVTVVHGYLAHADSIALIRSADLLFLPMQNLANGRRSSTVPGKTYEYLASGRPILGAVPPGDTRDILQAAGHQVCAPDDVGGLARAITVAMTERTDPPVDDRLAARFSYKSLTHKVEEVINEVAQRQPLTSATRVASPVNPDRRLNVLVVAYYFPPIGGAGVQRSLKFVRYLPDRGCRLAVITGPGLAPSGRWTPVDETLNDDIPEGTRIVRLAGDEPRRAAVWVERAQRWLRLRSRWSRWWIDGVVEAAAEARDIDVLIASASPYETIEACAKLARTKSPQWIADLRDSWAMDEMMVFPTGLHRQLEMRRMRRLLGSAAAIVMSTPEAARQLVGAFPELADRPVVAIPNGYDAADFASAEADARDPEKFRIVHSGYLHTEAGLAQRRRSVVRQLIGGMTPGVDILTRSHVFLLEAVDRLLERDPTLSERLEVHFAGVISDIGRELTSRSPVTVVHGYLAHADSIALIRSADLLFLPMQNLANGRRSSTVPGKTYEYLASGRPILGAVPPGDTRDILQAAGHQVCAPDDTTAISEVVAAAIARHDASLPAPDVAWNVVQAFERRELARHLADLVRLVSVGATNQHADARPT